MGLLGAAVNTVDDRSASNILRSQTLVADSIILPTPANTKAAISTPTATLRSSMKLLPATSNTIRSRLLPTRSWQNEDSAPASSPTRGDDDDPLPTSPHPADRKPIFLPISLAADDEHNSDESDELDDDESVDSDGGKSDDEDELDASELPSNSDSVPSTVLESSTPGVPAGSVYPTLLPSLESIEDSTADTGKRNNTALIASLTTIGILLAVFALVCLVRHFIVRRRTRRDTWTQRSSHYLTDNDSNSNDPEKPAFEPRGFDVPSGWVDVERADSLSPPRPLFVTNATVGTIRQSGMSAESYGNLTREPLAYRRASDGYATSLASNTPSTTVPPAAVITSRWSSSQAASTAYLNTPRGSIHSLESFKSETIDGARFVNAARRSLAYRLPPIAPEQEFQTETVPPLPSRHAIKSELRSVSFPSVQEPMLVLLRAASIESIPRSSISSDTSLPPNRPTSLSTTSIFDNPGNPSRVGLETWTGTHSSSRRQSSITVRSNSTATINSTSKLPGQPNASNGLFPSQDPFASPLDHEETSLFSV